MIYDVTIVGAGPAGSYLGYLLARSGVNVVILDKELFPRDKVCGGGISNKTRSLIQFDISPVVQRTIRGAYLTYSNRDTVVKDLDERGGCTVLRSEFDAFLLEKAKESGAEFRGGCTYLSALQKGAVVDISTSTGCLRSRFLIGADGVFSRVRTSLFRRDLVTFAPAIEALVHVPEARREVLADRVVFDFGGMPGGYGWIFPKTDHLNVGVFSVLQKGGLRQHLFRFMHQYGILRDPEKVTVRGHSIPLRNRGKVFQRGNVWLVGDAAGFAESFYGEGIYFAIKGAEIASRAFLQSVGNSHAPTYSQLVRRELVPDLEYSRITARAFFSGQKFGFYRMTRNRYVNHCFAELIAGRLGHREAFYRTLLTFPYWLFSEMIPPATAAEL